VRYPAAAVAAAARPGLHVWEQDDQELQWDRRQSPGHGTVHCSLDSRLGSPHNPSATSFCTHTRTRTRTTSSAHAPHIVSAILTCNSADAEIARHASRFEFDEFDEFRTSFLALPVAVARSQMVPFDLPNALS